MVSVDSLKVGAEEGHWGTGRKGSGPGLLNPCFWETGSKSRHLKAAQVPYPGIAGERAGRCMEAHLRHVGCEGHEVRMSRIH